MSAIWFLANWTQGEFTLFRPVRFFMMDCGNQVPFLRGFSSSAGHGGKGWYTPFLTKSCCVPIPAKWPGDVELVCIYSTWKPLKLTGRQSVTTQNPDQSNMWWNFTHEPCWWLVFPSITLPINNSRFGVHFILLGLFGWCRLSAGIHITNFWVTVFFLTSSYQKQKSASCLVVTLGKRKAANEMCQRYTDNKLPSSLGKARTWSNIAMENPLFPIGNSFTNCGFSMAMLDYRRLRSWLEIPAIVDDCLATR